MGFPWQRNLALWFLVISTGKTIKGEHEVEEITGESEGTPRKSGRKGMSHIIVL